MNRGEHYRGGRVEPDEPLEDEPRRVVRYACFAEGCPMPGTLFPEHARNGVCAWHYSVQPTDIPKVTSQLRAWECVAREIEQARRMLCGPVAADPAALELAYHQAWDRLRPMLSAGWLAQLQPATIRTSKGEDTRHPQSYGDWAKHLEQFLGARVVEVLSMPRPQEHAQRGRQPLLEEEAPW